MYSGRKSKRFVHKCFLIDIFGKLKTYINVFVNFQLPGVGGGASSLRKHGQARISDSGYLSHIAGSSDVPTTTSTVTSTSKTSKASEGSSGGKESAATAQGADPHQLSEQTIHAMLRPLSFRGM